MTHEEKLEFLHSRFDYLPALSQLVISYIYDKYKQGQVLLAADVEFIEDIYPLHKEQ